MRLCRERGLCDQTAVIASVMPLASAQQASDLAAKYNHLDIGQDIIARLAASPGTQIASETAQAVKEIDGLRGICVMSDDCVSAREVILSSGMAES